MENIGEEKIQGGEEEVTMISLLVSFERDGLEGLDARERDMIIDHFRGRGIEILEQTNS